METAFPQTAPLMGTVEFELEIDVAKMAPQRDSEVLLLIETGRAENWVSLSSFIASTGGKT